MYCPKCGTENSDGAKFCKGCGAVMEEVSPSSSHEAASIPQQIRTKRPKKKGCLIVVGIAFLIFVILMIVALLNGGEADFTTANIQNAVIAKEIDPQTKEALIEQDVFPQDTQVVYVTCYVKNVPADTKVAALWTYLPSGETLAGDPVYLEGDAQVQFNVEMPNGFFPGEYQVDLLIDDEIAETLQFLVE